LKWRRAPHGENGVILDRFRLDGRTALVTGASRNIGAAISRAFAEAGATLIVNARDADALQAHAAELRSRFGVPVTAVAADLSIAGERARLIDAVAGLGAVDVLVNNATSSGRPDSMLATTPEQWQSAIEVNVTAPFELSRAVIPGMQARGRGAIINVLSTAAFHVVPPMLAYGAMKSALWTMTKYLARECAPAVRVNAICPGTVQAGGELKVPSWAKLLPLTALGRVGDAEELAATALYLASDASSYTTGQVVFVDGGRVMLP
jgi:NAD(P)-dependent dehydrogenase (short-subunit alcohol dehydrogenase family)